MSAVLVELVKNIEANLKNPNLTAFQIKELIEKWTNEDAVQKALHGCKNEGKINRIFDGGIRVMSVDMLSITVTNLSTLDQIEQTFNTFTRSDLTGECFLDATCMDDEYLVDIFGEELASIISGEYVHIYSL